VEVKLRRADDATRIALVALSQLIDWGRLLTIVKPETLIRWHRKGFRLFWRWKSMPVVCQNSSDVYQRGNLARVLTAGVVDFGSRRM
jgi:hypothetical protein